MQLAEALLPLGSVPRSFIAMEKVGVKSDAVDALDNWNGRINNNDMKVTIDTVAMGFLNKTAPPRKPKGSWKHKSLMEQYSMSDFCLPRSYKAVKTTE